MGGGGGVHRGADGRVRWGKSRVRGAAARWGWGQQLGGQQRGCLQPQRTTLNT